MTKPPRDPKRIVRVPAPKPRFPLPPPTRKHKDRDIEGERKKWRKPLEDDEEAGD